MVFKTPEAVTDRWGQSIWFILANPEFVQIQSATKAEQETGYGIKGIVEGVWAGSLTGLPVWLANCCAFTPAW